MFKRTGPQELTTVQQVVNSVWLESDVTDHKRSQSLAVPKSCVPGEFDNQFLRTMKKRGLPVTREITQFKGREIAKDLRHRNSVNLVSTTVNVAVFMLPEAIRHTPKAFLKFLVSFKLQDTCKSAKYRGVCLSSRHTTVQDRAKFFVPPSSNNTAQQNFYFFMPWKERM